MELREYYKILKANASVVVYAIVIAVVVAYAWSVRVSQAYNVSLLLNISRTGSQSTSDYRYDQFYRLQADDKFAETVVEWLKSPGVSQDIFAKAGVNSDQKTMRDLSKSFQAEKLSSNLVSVKYSIETNDEAAKIAPVIESILADHTKNLNSAAKDPNWFQIDMSNLIVLKNVQDLPLNLGIAGIAGLFLGALLAFGKHYISDKDQ